MPDVKPFALGALRANVIITKHGERRIRISGCIKQRKGHKGVEISPYIAEALGKWLLENYPCQI